jgi:hypothetical protein
MKVRTIEKVVTKSTSESQTSDFAYWQSKSFAERLAALEEIRREYNSWKYTDAEQRFQRVYRVVKLKQS